MEAVAELFDKEEASLIVSRDWLTDDVFELTCSRPVNFTFMAGQNAGLAVNGEERDYTIIAAHKETVSFLIRMLPEGKISKALAELPLQSPVRMGKARGYLVKRDSDRKMVCVGTGTGIAPFLAMMNDGVKIDYLIHGAKTFSELFYKERCREGAVDYVCCISRETSPLNTDYRIYEGYVTRFVEEELPAGQYDFYICGKWDMIREVVHVIDSRFPDSAIYNEGFY